MVYIFLDQLFEYYSQIGICNNKNILLVCLQNNTHFIYKMIIYYYYLYIKDI